MLSTLERFQALGAVRFPPTSPALHTLCNSLPLQGATLGHPPSCRGGSEALTVSARKREVESVVFARVEDVLVLRTESTEREGDERPTLRCNAPVGRDGREMNYATLLLEPRRCVSNPVDDHVQ